MSFPDIYCCSRLTAENIDLKKKYNKLKQQKNEIQKQLDIILEQKKIDSLLKNYVTTRNAYVQTETPAWIKTSTSRNILKSSKKSAIDDPESEKFSKLLSMQSQIMKRYEKEVKQNMEHLETITQLNGKIAQLESRQQKDEAELFKLKRELFKINGPSKISEGNSVKEVIKEKTKLKKENKILRAELDGLDKGFFDEVEDIKFALQQSAKLNKEYETVLKKMCQKYGVPFPNPEKVLNS